MPGHPTRVLKGARVRPFCARVIGLRTQSQGRACSGLMRRVFAILFAVEGFGWRVFFLGALLAFDSFSFVANELMAEWPVVMAWLAAGRW